MKKTFEAPELIIVYFNDDLSTDDPMTVSSGDMGGAGDEGGMIDND